MEDAWKPKFTGTPRGSCIQNSDVWATQEVGIPLNELGNTLRGRRPPDYHSLALNLTIPADVDISPDDGKLDLRKLFEENDVSEVSSPVDLEEKINRTICPTTTSPTALRISNVIAELSRTNGSVVTVSAKESGLDVGNQDIHICETANLVECKVSSLEDQGPTAV